MILRRGPALVFVEVKSRRGTSFGDPAEAVTPRKQEKIRVCAGQYLVSEEPDFEEARFDVVGILLGGPYPEIRQRQNAF